MPHHAAGRRNGRPTTFFREGDYTAYRELMAEWCAACTVQIRAYRLMPNYVHLIAVAHPADSLHGGIGEAHRRYTRRINLRQGGRGHLWQGRSPLYVMDEDYLLAAGRYVERNPDRPRLVTSAGQYRWNTASVQRWGDDEFLGRVKPLLDLVPDCEGLLRMELEDRTLAELRQHERTGRPFGDDGFVRRLERRLGRLIRRQKPG
jgi:putative transposase